MLGVDNTCKTNNQNRPYTTILCSNFDNKNVSAAQTLLCNESQAAWDFVFSCALPLLYGTVLRRVAMICSDGDDQAITAIEAALAAHIYGTSTRPTKRSRDYWHAVTGVFSLEYRGCKNDGGVDLTMQAWFYRAVRETETPQEFAHSISSLRSWLELERPPPCEKHASTPGVLQPTQRETLMQCLDKVCKLRADLALPWRMDSLTFGNDSTSGNEGEHHSIKTDRRVNNHATLATLQGCEENRLTQRDIDRCDRVEHLHRTTPITQSNQHAIPNLVLSRIVPNAIMLTHKDIENTRGRCVRWDSTTQQFSVWLPTTCTTSDATSPWPVFNRTRVVTIEDTSSEPRLVCSAKCSQRRGQQCGRGWSWCWFLFWKPGQKEAGGRGRFQWL